MQKTIKTMATKKKRNSIQISDIPTKLYQIIKKSADANVRTMGNEAVVALKEKFKYKD